MSGGMTCYPLIRGSASRARPSVKLNLFNMDETFTPVLAPRQPQTRSGFPSGVFGRIRKITAISRCVAIARSTESGFTTQAVKFTDAGFRRRLNNYRPIFASLPTGGVPAAGALGPLFLFVRSA